VFRTGQPECTASTKGGTGSWKKLDFNSKFD
jgi:hypothetical protein